jgi:hypothetical protein
LNIELMRLLNFSAEDLEANRAGRMSVAQTSRLKQRRRRSVLIGIGAMLVAALIATTFLYLGNQQASSILMLVGWGVAILNAVMMGVFLRHWLRLGADIGGGTVATICGATTFTVRMLNPRMALYLVRVEQEAGAVELDVARETFEALRRHQGHCCFYRAPYTGTLLAVDMV